MSIDESIDRLRAALAALGLELPTGRDVAAAWDTLDRELAPLALPADLRRLLQRVDVGRLPLVTHPRPVTLDFALWSWREFRDGRGFPFPAGLFPWCYESHDHLFVELDGPGGDGGAMFEWAFAGSDFKLRFRSARDWVETAVAVIDEHAFERREHDGRVSLLADVDRWRELAAARLAAAGPHAVYGREHTFGEEEDRWPAHWSEAARLVRQDPPPACPPMSVVDVRALTREGDVHALVTGRVTYLGGRAGEATRIWLEDDTGALDVLCPAEIRGRAAVAGGNRGPFRVELVAHRQRRRPAIDWYSLASPVDGGATGFPRLLAHQPPDATATILHPPAG